MPLIRYKVGDLGSLSTSEQPCGCGRTLPILDCVEGRADDVLLTRDGRRVGRLDPVFKTRLPLREAQIIQESLSRVRVRFVPGPHFSAEALDIPAATAVRPAGAGRRRHGTGGKH